MESGYLWYYCNEKFDLFKDVFNHLIEKHNAETFKIKKLKFYEKEGVFNYKFKPLDGIQCQSAVLYQLYQTLLLV
jgi:hypothetical protein